MGGFRAKDADRERYVDIIEAAYVDGQLSEQDRELRVSRALTAQTLDELDALTRDLQDRPAVVAPRVATPTAAAPRAAKLVIGGAFAVIMIAVLLIFGAVGLAFFSVAGGSDESPTVVTSGEDWAVPVPAEVDVAEAPSFAMTAPEVRQFVRAYEREFGTLEAYDVGFYPTRVGVQVPVRGSRPRFERWTWDGEWTQDTEAAGVTGLSEVVDLGTLDVRRLFANITTAKKSLRVDRGKLTHVVFHRWQGEAPSVNVYIGNSFGESGYLRTTPSGDVVRAYPYDG
jgi:hypothetical protein